MILIFAEKFLFYPNKVIALNLLFYEQGEPQQQMCIGVSGASPSDLFLVWFDLNDFVAPNFDNQEAMLWM